MPRPSNGILFFTNGIDVSWLRAIKMLPPSCLSGLPVSLSLEKAGIFNALIAVFVKLMSRFTVFVLIKLKTFSVFEKFLTLKSETIFF